MLLNVLVSSPWRFRTLMGELARLLAQVHRTNPEGFPPGDDLLDRRLALTRDTAERLDHEPLQRALVDARSSPTGSVADLQRSATATFTRSTCSSGLQVSS